MRDSNNFFETKLDELVLVDSLPMRDSNITGFGHDPEELYVDSLPMRDSNLMVYLAISLEFVC